MIQIKLTQSILVVFVCFFSLQSTARDDGRLISKDASITAGAGVVIASNVLLIQALAPTTMVMADGAISPNQLYHSEINRPFIGMGRIVRDRLSKIVPLPGGILDLPPRMSYLHMEKVALGAKVGDTIQLAIYLENGQGSLIGRRGHLRSTPIFDGTYLRDNKGRTVFRELTITNRPNELSEELKRLRGLNVRVMNVAVTAETGSSKTNTDINRRRRSLVGDSLDKAPKRSLIAVGLMAAAYGHMILETKDLHPFQYISNPSANTEAESIR